MGVNIFVTCWSSGKGTPSVSCEIVRSVFACRWSCGHDFFAIDQWLGFCETPGGSPVIETGNIYTSILSKALFRWP